MKLMINSGISLKLANHRFLFVNSHLAAHTARNSARMSNIAKIKNDLQLDCFLPKSDPSSTEADISDRFDTVFWCGDCKSGQRVDFTISNRADLRSDRTVNFRLDVSRVHAEWLVEQKSKSLASAPQLTSCCVLIYRIRRGSHMGPAEKCHERSINLALPRVRRRSDKLPANIQIRRVEISSRDQ